MKRRSFKVLSGSAAIAVASVLASACTSPRDVLGPKESPCYRAVAVAHLAVEGAGRFSGVRQLDGKSLLMALSADRIAHPGVPQRIRANKDALCLVAYRGHFSASRVRSPWRVGTKPATYAVVLVTESDSKVVATLLLGRPPVRLTRFLPPLR
ncbi:MAG: hypothetical protein JWM85_154 [Acidimicrobiaceae bacterium]|nr:hypothetical protein [Acidimicrobiaceae bacterium]